MFISFLIKITEVQNEANNKIAKPMVFWLNCFWNWGPFRVKQQGIESIYFNCLYDLLRPLFYCIFSE
jgi:hypothetical protein